MFKRIMQPEMQHCVKSQNLHRVDPDTGALLVNRAARVQGRRRCRQGIKWTKSRVHSKLKVQNSSTFQGPKLHFSSTKIIDKKPYPRHGHSKVSKQSEIKYCFLVLVTCIQVLASKLSTNAKFQNLQDLNSRTFQVLSSTLSVFKHFQGPWSSYSKFKHFQGFLKHAINPEWHFQQTETIASVDW